MSEETGNSVSVEATRMEETASDPSPFSNVWVKIENQYEGDDDVDLGLGLDDQINSEEHVESNLPTPERDQGEQAIRGGDGEGGSGDSEVGNGERKQQSQIGLGDVKTEGLEGAASSEVEGNPPQLADPEDKQMTSNKNFTNQSYTTRFKCADCKQSFPSKGNLMTHAYIHTRIPPFQCKYCEQRFVFIRELHQHLHSHEDATLFTCAHCKKGFRDLNSLNLHLLLKHGCSTTVEK